MAESGSLRRSIPRLSVQEVYAVPNPTHQEPGNVPKPPLFHPGRTVATQGAVSACPPDYLFQCLQRHLSGDWGDVCDEDKKSNDAAVRGGNRILSAYPIDPGKPCKGYGDNCVWIITEWDRSVTTFLLPGEY
jgi:hypothetical protein